MATKKQKRAAGIAKREAFEAEQREHGLKHLALAQAGRAAERAKAEEARKNRAKVTSKKLAKQHRLEKKHETQGVKEFKPAPRPTLSQMLMLGAAIDTFREQNDSGL